MVYYDLSSFNMSNITQQICSPANEIAVYLFQNKDEKLPGIGNYVLILRRGKQLDYDQRVYQLIPIEKELTQVSVQIFLDTLLIIGAATWNGQTTLQTSRIHLHGPNFLTTYSIPQKTPEVISSSHLDVTYRVANNIRLNYTDFTISFNFSQPVIFANLTNTTTPLNLSLTEQEFAISSQTIDLEPMLNIDGGPLFGLTVVRNEKETHSNCAKYEAGTVKEISVSNLKQISSFSMGGGAVQYLDYVTLEETNKYVMGLYQSSGNTLVYIFSMDEGLKLVMETDLKISCSLASHLLLDQASLSDIKDSQIVAYLSCKENDGYSIRYVFFDATSKNYKMLGIFRDYISPFQKIETFASPGQNYIFLSVMNKDTSETNKVRLIRATHKFTPAKGLFYTTFFDLKDIYNGKILLLTLSNLLARYYSILKVSNYLVQIYSQDIIVT